MFRFQSWISRLFAGALLAAVTLTSTGATPAPSGVAAAPAVPMPIAWTLTPAQIAATCKAEIAGADKRIAAITRGRSARTFATVVLPLESAMADLNDNTAAQTFLSNVSTDKAVRDASQACNVAQSTFFSEVSARPALYAALKAANSSNTARDEAERKLTALWLTSSFRAGAGLSDSKRAEFVKLSGKLGDLQTQFAANLGNDATTITIAQAQTAGLTPDFIATLTQHGDAYVVPVNESTNAPFMQHASDESARKMFYIAYHKRGGMKNVALLGSAIAIRDRLAHLFGYSSWAAYVLADKMAQTPQRVESFLHQIDAAILPKAKAERTELAALKGTAGFSPWDTIYYDNKLRIEKYSVDENAIKAYFPVQHTIDAVLGVYSKLLDVSFSKIDAPAVWNPEVIGYEVHDKSSGLLLGVTYFDLYPRPGKYDHFANFPVIPRRVLPDGRVRAPIAVIVGNWARPAAGKPAVLSHDEVETFFHEFGHDMASMLADRPYETLTSGFRADFVEAPSQMLENWVWEPVILKEISANVTTGAPLPDDLIAKMIAARYVHYALATTTQILYATVDMRLHGSGANVDSTAIWKRTVAQVTPFMFVEGTLPQAGFGHLMGGYDAGYYGYLWSKVYAQDMFTQFKSQGLENAALGLQYRAEILGPARTREPDAEVAAFLGRPMNPNAFYRELGIAPQP
ncbi:MAG: M3 family metallopeptidase [Candidatus Velthaea sp.]